MSEYDVCKHGRIRCAECAYVEELEDRIEELEQQNKRYREALEFYADEDNYRVTWDDDYEPILHDGGEKARQALERDND